MSDTRMVKGFQVSNKHYRGLSERWQCEVTYIGGGPRSHFEGTMEEVQAYMLRTMVKTGQPKNDKAMVTIIQDSDENALVHRAGCADIARAARKRSFLSQWDIQASTEQEVANDAWSDFIGEGMTEADALGYTRFLPCTAGLLAP